MIIAEDDTKKLGGYQGEIMCGEIMSVEYRRIGEGDSFRPSADCLLKASII
jgi:hypothetical protein